jgi:hypothetical protein
MDYFKVDCARVQVSSQVGMVVQFVYSVQEFPLYLLKDGVV